VVAIVEGDGEVAALPILLRRLAAWLSPQETVTIARPVRVRRDRFLNRDPEFHRFIHLAASKAGEDGWILVLLDADDDCPAVKGKEIVRRAVSVAPNRRVSAVLAKREYEGWFLAAASSLRHVRGFDAGEDANVDAESVRNAKGWMSEHLQSGRYREILVEAQGLLGGGRRVLQNL